MGMLATALRGERPAVRRPVIDYLGFMLFTSGISALLYGVSLGGMRGFGNPVVVASLAFSAVAVVAFVVVERRAAEPIVPLRLFRYRMVIAAVGTGFLSGMAMFGALAFVPLFLQGVIRMSAMGTGMVLMPFVLAWVCMSIVSARLVLRIGYRTVVLAGMLSLTASFLLMSRWGPQLTTLEAIRDAVFGGIGMGLSMVPMLIAVQSAVPRSDLGVATSLTQFFRSVGGAVGVAVMGAVKSHRLDAGLPLVNALHGVFMLGLGICVIAVAAAFLVPPGRAHDLARPELRREPTRVGG
jgi:predicted MFS family arabinose efflux permease